MFARDGAITRIEARTPLRDKFTMAKWSTPRRCLCVNNVTTRSRQLLSNVDNVKRVKRSRTIGWRTRVGTRTCANCDGWPSAVVCVLTSMQNLAQNRSRRQEFLATENEEISVQFRWQWQPNPLHQQYTLSIWWVLLFWLLIELFLN